MTGPEHYLAAEGLLGSLRSRSRDEMTVESASIAAEAQVHATLALAAATALRGTDSEWQRWNRAVTSEE